MNTQKTINKDVIKHIRAVESSLKNSLNYDEFNCYHYAKMLDKTNCENLLSECVLSKYCISIYNKFIYPMYIYIEFTNNFLSYNCFAEHMNLTVDTAKQLINNGRAILNCINN